MKVTIFYSWQSTTNRDFNMNFIQIAINSAIKEIKKNKSLQFVDEFVIDRDTMNISGSPPIAETIEGKIRQADIFIGDITIVTEPNIKKNTFIKKVITYLFKKFVSSEEPKKLPNPNVLLEYGQARECLTNERIIGVINTAYGNPWESEGIIPFDINHLRWPIKYECSKDNDKEQALKSLTRNLSEAIKSIINNNLELQKKDVEPFKTWSEWGNFLDTKVKYYSNKEVEDLKVILRKEIIQPKTIRRITGLSGLGKTRFIYEMFRPQKGDSESIIFSNLALYYNSKYSTSNNYIDTINKLIRDKKRKIIILDNLDIILFEEIKDYIKSRNSSLSLIIIDSNPEKNYPDLDKLHTYILNQEYFKSIVNDILDSSYKGLSITEKSQIISFSKGFTMIAVLLAENNNGNKFINFDNYSILTKILGNYGNDQIARKLLKICSLFKNIGYIEDLEEEINLLITNKIITGIDLDSEILKDKFYKLFNDLQNRGIIEVKGRYFTIRPLPLAIALASEWWDEIRKDKVVQILERLKDNDELFEGFFERLKFISSHTKIPEFAKDLCSNQIQVYEKKTLNNLEFINTSLGSSIISHLSEIVPETVAETLENIFKGLDKKEIFNIKEGRRNLVWALEKLCFRKESFYKATRILFSFALAENESYGNSATGQFVHLFLILLPGTEVSLKVRLDLLKELSETSDLNELKLITKAIKAGLHTLHFSRTVGAENQGSALPLKDYNPSVDEVHEYQKGIISQLEQIILKHENMFDDVYEVVKDSIRDVSHIGNISIIENLVKLIINKRDNYAPEILNSLSLTLRFEPLNEHDKQITNQLIYSLQPQKIENEIKSIITNPIVDWSDYQDVNGNIDKRKINAEELANKLANRKDWFEFLKHIYEGEQIQAYNFGNKLGELSDESFAREFIDKSVNVLKTIVKEKRSADALAGFLTGYKNKDFVKTELEKIIKDEVLFENAFYIFTKAAPDYEAFNSLFELINTRKLHIKNFNYLRFGNIYYSLKPEDIIKLIKNISSYGSEGEWVSISLIHSSLQNNPEYFEYYKEIIKKLVLKKNLLLDSLQFDRSVISPNSWKYLVFRLFKNNTNETSKILAENIVDFLKENYKFGHFTYEIKEIIDYLFENKFEEVWPYFGNALLVNDSPIYLILKDIIGAYNGISTKKDGILFKDHNHNKLIDWCKNNLPDSVRYIAGMMPVYKLYEKNDLPESHLKINEIDQENPFHPFARSFINKFGNDDIVLSEFSAQLGSYGYMGSAIPMLNNKKKIYEELKIHSIRKVRDWALSHLSYINDEMKAMKNFEDEMFM